MHLYQCSIPLEIAMVSYIRMTVFKTCNDCSKPQRPCCRAWVPPKPSNHWDWIRCGSRPSRWGLGRWRWILWSLWMDDFMVQVNHCQFFSQNIWRFCWFPNSHQVLLLIWDPFHLRHKIWRMSSYQVESCWIWSGSSYLPPLTCYVGAPPSMPGRCPSSHLLRYDLVQPFGPEVVRRGWTWCMKVCAFFIARFFRNGSWVCSFYVFFLDPDVCFRFLLLFLFFYGSDFKSPGNH